MKKVQLIFINLICFFIISCSVKTPMQVIKYDKENNIVYINKGNNDLDYGQNLKITTPSEMTNNPVTGKVIVLDSKNIATAKITRISNDFVIAQIISRSDSSKIGRGDLVYKN